MIHLLAHKIPIFFHGFLLSIYLAINACTIIDKALDAPRDLKNLPQYWLTTSMYVGLFYDDDKTRLLDYRPFSAIEDAKTYDGFTIYPPNSDETIPAGTLLKILDISFPKDQAFFKRPIYSPRDNIWIYLKVARERGNVNIFREQTHILLVPKNIISQAQLQTFLSNFLSKKDPNSWLLQQESYIQKAIFDKHPVIGMKREHVIAALGPAIRKHFQKTNELYEKQEIWHYHDYFIVITNDKVTKVNRLIK
jgi:hypothetical protein